MSDKNLPLSYVPSPVWSILVLEIWFIGISLDMGDTRGSIKTFRDANSAKKGPMNLKTMGTIQKECEK